MPIVSLLSSRDCECVVDSTTFIFVKVCVCVCELLLLVSCVVGFVLSSDHSVEYFG